MSTLRYEDLVALMNRIKDRQPAFISNPKGRLQATEHLPEGDETIYVLNSPLQEEPMVLARPEVLDQVRSMTGASAREIASFLAYKAESTRWFIDGLKLPE